MNLAVGFGNGNLQIVDSLTLEDCLKAPFSYSKDHITHIEFSHDSTYLATAVTKAIKYSTRVYYFL
jgi:hypothetical protein